MALNRPCWCAVKQLLTHSFSTQFSHSFLLIPSSCMIRSWDSSCAHIYIQSIIWKRDRWLPAKKEPFQTACRQPHSLQLHRFPSVWSALLTRPTIVFIWCSVPQTNTIRRPCWSDIPRSPSLALFALRTSCPSVVKAFRRQTTRAAPSKNLLEIWSPFLFRRDSRRRFAKNSMQFSWRSVRGDAWGRVESNSRSGFPAQRRHAQHSGWPRKLDCLLWSFKTHKHVLKYLF